MQPNDDYAIRNLTVEAETDWRYCFPTLNMHHQDRDLWTKIGRSLNLTGHGKYETSALLVPAVRESLNQRNKIDGAKDSYLYYFDAPSSLRPVFKLVLNL